LVQGSTGGLWNVEARLLRYSDAMTSGLVLLGEISTVKCSGVHCKHLLFLVFVQINSWAKEGGNQREQEVTLRQACHIGCLKRTHYTLYNNYGLSVNHFQSLYLLSIIYIDLRIHKIRGPDRRPWKCQYLRARVDDHVLVRHVIINRGC